MNSALKPNTIRSAVRKIEIPENGFINTVKECFGSDDAFVVAYLDYAVMAGRYSKGAFSFHESCVMDFTRIIKIRVFTGTKELFAWRTSGSLSARFRVDGEGEVMEAIDARQALWGTRAESKGDFSLLTEERGFQIYLPFGEITADSGEKRVFLTTRNYVGYNDLYQAGYCDCRFTGFQDYTGAELK